MGRYASKLWVEDNELLAVSYPASQTVAQASARIKGDTHQHFVAILLNGLIAAGGTLDFKVEQANAASGGTVKAISGKSMTQKADTADDDATIIEWDNSELDVNNGFFWFVVTATPAVAASLMAFIVLGVDPTVEPVPTTNWTQVVN